jgi:hypothetical protein
MELGPLQKLWISELKSNTYNQTTKVLFDSEINGYCCLGVCNKVCDLQEEDSICLEHTFHLIGLRDDEGSLKEPIEINECKYNSLVELNDYAGLTFKEIAELMEKDPDNFFMESK